MSETIHSRIALVLGATGSVGAAAVQALHADGWRIRALHRNPAAAGKHPLLAGAIEWVAGDAMRAEDVRLAAGGAGIIVHAINPPRYRRWRELAIPMLANAIGAAAESGARLVFPGNVYNFGPDAGPVVDERSPQHPLTRKGAIRVDMENLLADASARGVRSLILRAGDFFGPHATSSWFGGAMVKPGRPPNSITYPGKPEAGHAWAYLPDLAETLARLVAIERELPTFAVFHFGGHWLEAGGEMVDAIRSAVGTPGLPMRGVPWPLLYAAAPFSSFLRELIEMRYLWMKPLRLDNRKLVATLGSEPHTPLDEAVKATLRSFQCIPAQAE